MEKLERVYELTTLDWNIYKVLKQHIGKANPITAKTIMEMFRLNDTAEVRRVIAKLKNSEIIKRVICANQRGYYLASNEKEALDYLKSDKQRYLKGLVANSNQVEKLSLHNQARLTFGKYEREVVIALSEDLLVKEYV